MLMQLKRTLELSKMVNEKMSTDDADELEQLKDNMKDLMVSPIGWHTMGIPLLISFVLSLLAFTVPQTSIWETVFSLMAWPDKALSGGVIVTGFIYCLVMFPSLTLIARGNHTALKTYINLIYFTLAVVAIYFLKTLISALFGGSVTTFTLISSCIGMVFFLVALSCLNSHLFFKSNAFYLHNRVWRKQLNLRNKTHSK
ncbi:hypothetical protein RBJ15_10850 [Pantoea sp. BS_4]|uniref:hypothetical protein n=1 Tax=unclassified Pantoea TaxID=2630326 RepID=UPI0035BF6766